MYITCWKSTANLQLIDNLSFRLTHRKWRAVLTDWTAEFWSLWVWTAIDCLCAVSDGMLRVECGHTYFNLYLQNLWPPINLFRHHEFSSLGNTDIPLRNPVWETLVQCKLASSWLLTKYHEVLLHVNTMSSGGFSQNNPDGDRTDSVQRNFTGLRTSGCKNVIKMFHLHIDKL
jgi:hypothetical protein